MKRGRNTGRANFENGGGGRPHNEYRDRPQMKDWARRTKIRACPTRALIDILEAKSYKEAIKRGERRPFEVADKIVVTSYEFGAVRLMTSPKTNWGFGRLRRSASIAERLS